MDRPRRGIKRGSAIMIRAMVSLDPVLGLNSTIGLNPVIGLDSLIAVQPDASLISGRPGSPREVGFPLGQYLVGPPRDDLRHSRRLVLEHRKNFPPEGLHQSLSSLLADTSVGVGQIADDGRFASGQAEAANIDSGRRTILPRTGPTHDLTLEKHRALAFFSSPGAAPGPQSPS